jgi:hypothetical protein
MMMATTDLHMAEANWHSIYRLGAVAALLAVVFAVLEYSGPRNLHSPLVRVR